MALINCPECGKEVSDMATACPNCGMPINKNNASNEVQKVEVTNQDYSSGKKTGLIIVVIGVILLIAWVVRGAVTPGFSDGMDKLLQYGGFITVAIGVLIMIVYKINRKG